MDSVLGQQIESAARNMTAATAEEKEEEKSRREIKKEIKHH